ncbi:hypothetical protein [Streptomyces sp. NPDC000983]|uniref:hypothetical protein n=1 Tax=Streptomyces sp. NPDC000983 TaxID=3154373 RepID=UPI0033330562
MTRSTHTAPGLRAAAAITALLALLTALLAAPAHAGRHERSPSWAGAAPYADQALRADDTAAALRSLTALTARDTGERPSPPGPATVPARRTTAGPHAPAVTPSQQPPAPRPTRKAARHPLRAPPPPPGTEVTTTPFP